jgi:4a-hydroxytetrahydrobiopterin dehydratase
MWQNKNNSLYRLFEFEDFSRAFAFMTEVAAEAERQNHHPRWQNEWNRVEIWLSTHDTNGVTDKDQQLAKAIDRIYQKYENA